MDRTETTIGHDDDEVTFAGHDTEIINDAWDIDAKAGVDAPVHELNDEVRREEAVPHGPFSSPRLSFRALSGDLEECRLRCGERLFLTLRLLLMGALPDTPRGGQI